MGAGVRDLLKLLPIYAISLLAQLVFQYVNFSFMFSRLKNGNLKIPVSEHIFSSWWSFTVAAWLFNATFYLAGSLLTVWAYKLSIDSFGGLYSGFIVASIAAIIMSVFFMYIFAGEVPNKNGWIALILVVLASFFAANSGKGV